MKPITIPFRCDALLDQGRYIGPDPVGHKCSRPATWELYDGHGPLFCDHCRGLWLDPREKHRVTFGPSYGRTVQQQFYDEFMKRFDRVKDTPSESGGK